MIHENAATYALNKLITDKPVFPEGIQISTKSIGKGSNNKAFPIILDNNKYVLRVPRRRSDTQQWGSALWEFRQTLKASQLGVAPLLHNAWYARHAKDDWTSGLYLIMDRYLCNLEEAFSEKPDMRNLILADDCTVGKQIAQQTVNGLEKLADCLLFVYDLKPSNIVVRFNEDGRTVDAKIVDFGRDFCEWDTKTNDPDARIPIINGLRELITTRENARGDQADDSEKLVSHIIFAVMLVQLAATTTHNLYEDREHIRLGEDMRSIANLFSPYARRLLDSMQGSNIALVRWVLRNDEVRGVMRHYHGRRNSGTGRTLLYARGVETFTHQTQVPL